MNEDDKKELDSLIPVILEFVAELAEYEKTLKQIQDGAPPQVH